MLATAVLFLAFAAPRDDFKSVYAEVKAKYDSCFKDLRVDMKAWQPFVLETFKKNDFTKFSGEQLLELYDLNLFSDLPGPEDDESLAAFRKGVMARPDDDPADDVLKLLLVGEQNNPDNNTEIARLWVLLSKQPHLGKLMKAKYRDTFLGGITYYVPSAVFKENSSGTVNVLAAMPKPWPVEIATNSESLWTSVFSEANVGKEKHEVARLAAVDAIDRAMKVEKGERTLHFLAGSYGRLTGAAAQGKLIGQPVTGMNLLWSSDPKIAKMDDLRGRVVILDFWATWCGPCVASMPKLKQTVAAYANYPVIVLGVTSVQGSVNGLEEKPIDVTGNPQKEFDLMKDYMAKKEITWPVVFTKEDVFNPTFGIRGIPFTAIIAPDGKVRYIGLHPGIDHEKIEKLVNDLLREFKLPAPSGG